MQTVLILVEGQTEERFVKDVINPHLQPRGKVVIPTIAKTKRVKQGPQFKGGITDYKKVENDLKRLLGDTHVLAVTTFIDYYGLPSDFPGMSDRPQGKALERVQHVEKVWAERIDHLRFYPFLMIHEFEALLFSDPQKLCNALHQQNIFSDFLAIREQFSTPEDINDDPHKAPSKRILDLCAGFRKTLHGPLVAQRIGLEVLRYECPHFNQWLSWLEKL